jgi:hypothetical protein
MGSPLSWCFPVIYGVLAWYVRKVLERARFRYSIYGVALSIRGKSISIFKREFGAVCFDGLHSLPNGLQS